MNALICHISVVNILKNHEMVTLDRRLLIVYLSNIIELFVVLWLCVFILIYNLANGKKQYIIYYILTLILYLYYADRLQRFPCSKTYLLSILNKQPWLLMLCRSCLC